MENIQHTKKPNRQKMTGILGFCYEILYKTQPPTLPHYQFKMAASNTLVPYNTKSLCETQQIHTSHIKEAGLHKTQCIGYLLDCCFCNHGHAQHKVGRNTTPLK